MENGIGLDWGVKVLITCSNGFRFKNINNTERMKNLIKEKKNILSKYKKVTSKRTELLKKISSEMLCIKSNYYNDIIKKIAKWNPPFISIEDIDTKTTIKAIHDTSFNLFVFKLKNMCKEKNIELRQVDRFYPSSKTCSRCSKVKYDLKYNDRIYKCEYCNLEIDRDLNASINIRDTKNFVRLI